VKLYPKIYVVTGENVARVSPASSDAAAAAAAAEDR